MRGLKKLSKSIQHFITNYNMYESFREIPQAEHKEAIKNALQTACSDLPMGIFAERFEKCKSKEDQQKVLHDLYDYLILSIRATTNLFLEIDGHRYISESQRNAEKIRKDKEGKAS